MLRGVIVCTLTICFGVATASAQSSGIDQFDRTVVFGDSLSDNGNLFATNGNPPPPYVDGRFSNGPVWIEQLLGPMNSPVQGTGVTDNVNVAFGGARADTDPNANGPIPGHPTQVGIFLGSGGTIGTNDLVVSWAGANDLFQAIPVATGQADLIAAGVNTANDQLANVQTLAGLGATTILVPNLPNIGAAPSFNGTPTSSGAGFLAANTFNQQLAGNLAAFAAANPGVNIIQMDIEAAFNAVLADPAAFGFTNVTDQCLTTISCVTGTTAEQNQFLFWDGVHPTEAGHALLAQYAALLFTTDQAAVDTAALGDAGLQAMMGTTENVFDRVQAWIDGTYARENGFHAEVIGIHGDLDANGNRNAYDYGLYGVRGGLDKQYGNALVGASAAILIGDTSSGALDAEMMVFQGNLYGSMFFGPMYVTGVAGASFAQYNDIERRTGLGNIVAAGETSGDQYGIAGEVGMVLPVGHGVSLVPSARIGYVDGSVDGYEETAPVLALAYGDRDTEVTFWSAELRASANVSLGATPAAIYGEVGYEDFISYDSGAITAALAGNTALPVSVNVDDPVARGFYFRAGLNGRISENVSFDVDYGLSLNDGEGETHSGKFRIKIGLGPSNNDPLH